MRLLGYPAEKVAILTTYNGQKHLIRDVIRKRCSDNPMIGWPSKVRLQYPSVDIKELSRGLAICFACTMAQ